MSAIVPLRLNERHVLMGYMFIGGATNRQVADKLGLTESWVSTVKHSPLFQQLLAQLRSEVRESTVTSVVERLMQEADATLDALIELRDRGSKEDSVRLGAAKELFDRQVPKVTKSEVENVHTLSFDPAAVHLMRVAIDEDEGREPPALAGVATVIPGVQQLRAKTLDEAILERDGNA